MTAPEWRESADPVAMLDHLFPQRGMDSVEPQTRKSRLYLLACARSAWRTLPGVSRAFAELGQKVYGEPQTNKPLRDRVYPLAEALIHCRGEADEINAINRELVALGQARMQDIWVEADMPPDQWSGFAHLAFGPFDRTTPNYLRIPPELHSAQLIREVFGNPHENPAPFDPIWRTDTVMRLVQHALSQEDFTVLPIIGDALQDADCDRDDILSTAPRK
ncbi:MAG: hypothetical protein U0792_14205 [Gemmataceae bacterium]